jgi:hypothetical protein
MKQKRKNCCFRPIHRSEPIPNGKTNVLNPRALICLGVIYPLKKIPLVKKLIG